MRSARRGHSVNFLPASVMAGAAGSARALVVTKLTEDDETEEDGERNPAEPCEGGNGTA